ncbi:MAG: TIM barrel protein [Pirellulaceae bacterium]
MYKNFSASGLGITGRQSELIELALTYAFRGMDVDMTDMLKRSQRTSFEDASKYLRAAEIKIGPFNCGVNLDADDEMFANQLAQVHPLSDFAAQLKADVATITLPSATDRLPFPEYFETISQRVKQVAEVLGNRQIRLGVTFGSGAERQENKKFPFVNNVESFLALVKDVASDGIGCVVDTWNWQVGGGNYDQIASLPIERIVAVRVGDLAEGATAADAKSADRVLPTTDGPINHVALAKYLADGGYQGSISPTASAAQYKGKTRETIVNNAQEAIDAILTEAGLPVPPRPMDMISSIPYEPTAMN